MDVIAPFDTSRQTWRATPDILGIVDARGVFVETNPAWKDILGLAPGDVEGRHFSDFLHPEDAVATDEIFAKMQSGIQALNFRNRYRHGDGHWVWLSWNAVPEGEQYFCMARDVTSEVENEARLKTREQEARLREQVLAMLGHDLKNPLAAITAALRMALKEDQTDRAEKVLTLASDAARRMNGLIHDISDFTNIRLGEGIVLQERSVDLGAIVGDAVAEARLLHPSALLVIDAEISSSIRCDTARIGQAVGHLIDNAVRHGQAARPITVQVRQDDEASRVSIRNEGADIPAEVRPLLFHPFFRHRTRSTEAGLGLGLYISREIAEAHGGDITVESANGVTAFTLTLPHQP